MFKNQIKILSVCLLMCIISGVVVYWLAINQQKKVAVIDAVKLFDGFNMKKELEGMAKEKLQSESKQLDSVSNALQMAKAINNNDDEIKKLAYSYNYMKAKLQEDYNQSNRDINTQVWKRLNPLLEEYGKSNGLRMIIGANGMGSVLYIDQHYELTDEAIKYVNKRYAEGN